METKIFFEGEYGKICGILNESKNSKEIVIICHGFSSHKNTSAKVVAELLEKLNISSLRIDLDNRGESELDFSQVNITKYIDQIIISTDDEKIIEIAKSALPDNRYNLWMLVATIANDKKDYSQAQQAYSEALALFKNHNIMTREKMAAQIGLVNALAAQNRFELAQEFSKDINAFKEKFYSFSFKLASDKFEDGELENSEKILKNLMENYNQQGMPFVLMSLIENQKGNKEEAQKYLDQLDNKINTDTNSLLLLAKANISMGNNQKAAAILERIDINNAADKSGEVLYTQGLIALDSNHGLAKDFFVKAINVEPEKSLYHQALALAEIRSGNQVKAEKILLESIQENKNDPKGILIYLKLAEDKVQAENNIKKMYADSPNLFAAPFSISVLKLNQDQIDEAMVWLNKAQIADQNNIQVKQLKADLLRLKALESAKKNELKTAQKYIQEAIQLSTGNTEYHYFSAMLYADAGEKESALAEVNNLAKHYPKISKDELALIKANIEINLKDYPSALASLIKQWKVTESTRLLQAIVRLKLLHFPTDQPYKEIEHWNDKVKSAESSLLLALAYQTGNQKEKAIAQFKKTLDIKENDYIALNNLAWLTLEKSPKKSLDYAKKAYLIKPENYSIADTYAWVLYKNNDSKSALPLLEKAYKDSNEDKAIAIHLAEVYRISGKTKASEALEIKHGI